MLMKMRQEAAFMSTMLFAAAGLVISVLGFSFGVPLHIALLAMAAVTVVIQCGLYVYLLWQLKHRIPKGLFILLIPRPVVLCQDQCSG